mgnify:CR=1 FL=1
MGKNGQKVVKMAQNASELAHFLVKNHKNEQFSFFCGTRRMDDLELVFAQNEMKLTIIPIYDTLLTPHKIKLDVEGILFYSPSAVESFFIKNKWPKNTYGFCIGTTTANALKKHTDQFYEDIFCSKQVHTYYLHSKFRDFHLLSNTVKTLSIETDYSWGGV